MRLARDQIEARLPHGGAMVLLDQVEHWSETEIACRSAAHRRQDNPLRVNDQLSVFAGIEIAAQAMALHGALINEGPPRQGVLASVKGVVAEADRLDDIVEDLRVEVVLKLRQSASFVYDFSLSAAGAKLLSGQASVFLK